MLTGLGGTMTGNPLSLRLTACLPAPLGHLLSSRRSALVEKSKKTEIYVRLEARFSMKELDQRFGG
jgi:hypothetical protein